MRVLCLLRLDELVDDLLQGHIGVGLAEEILLQFELAVLDGGDGESVDVADGTVAELQTGEYAERDILFLQLGMGLAQMDEPVAVDGIERALHVGPLLGVEVDVGGGGLAEFLHHFRPLEDVALEERHDLLGLMELGQLAGGFQLQHPFLLFQ